MPAQDLDNFLSAYSRQDAATCGAIIDRAAKLHGAPDKFIAQTAKTLGLEKSDGMWRFTSTKHSEDTPQIGGMNG